MKTSKKQKQFRHSLDLNDGVRIQKPWMRTPLFIWSFTYTLLIPYEGFANMLTSFPTPIDAMVHNKPIGYFHEL